MGNRVLFFRTKPKSTYKENDYEYLIIHIPKVVSSLKRANKRCCCFKAK